MRQVKWMMPNKKGGGLTSRLNSPIIRIPLRITIAMGKFFYALFSELFSKLRPRKPYIRTYRKWDWG